MNELVEILIYCSGIRISKENKNGEVCMIVCVPHHTHIDR